MSDIPEKPKKRKTLSLKLEPVHKYKDDFPSKFVDRGEGFCMVYREGGGMPTRVYGPDEIALAVKHAQYLAATTGETFHVLRSWRAFKLRG